MGTREEYAAALAQRINDRLRVGAVQICLYSNRIIIKRGSYIVARGNSLYINGKGAALLYGSFQAYEY